MCFKVWESVYASPFQRHLAWQAWPPEFGGFCSKRNLEPPGGVHGVRA